MHHKPPHTFFLFFSGLRGTQFLQRFGHTDVEIRVLRVLPQRLKFLFHVGTSGFVLHRLSINHVKQTELQVQTVNE